MNDYNTVKKLIASWKQAGETKATIVVNSAEATIGWPYVFGAAGQQCTPSTRRSYASRSSCPPAESEVILNKCQVCRSSNPKGSCSGCKWYPGGVTLCYDCRGFTRWLLAQVGISLIGAGATSQWNTAGNWQLKGEIKDIPKDVVSCVFINKGTKMEHTGMYVGNGWVIHCSGEVKKEQLSRGKWTHFAVPKGMEGGVPVSYPTLRKGSTGEYVTLMQTKLIQQGYDLSPYGADGSFGNKTLEALKQYQRDHGLTADGVCGSATWASLNAGKETLYTVSIPHMGLAAAEEIIKKYGGSMTKEGD